MSESSFSKSVFDSENSFAKSMHDFDRRVIFSAEELIFLYYIIHPLCLRHLDEAQVIQDVQNAGPDFFSSSTFYNMSIQELQILFHSNQFVEHRR